MFELFENILEPINHPIFLKRCFVTQQPVLTKNRWKVRAQDYAADVGILNSRIILSISRGSADYNETKELLHIIDQIICSELSDVNELVMVSDYSGLKRASLASRRLFTEFFLRNPKIKSIIFHDTTPFFRFILNFSTSFNLVKYPAFICATYENAIHKAISILEHSQPRLPDSGIKSDLDIAPPSHRNLLDVLEVLSQVSWSEPGVNEIENALDDDHPYKPVTDAFLIIKSDIDELLREKCKRVQSISSNTANIERLNQKIRAELEKSEALQRKEAEEQQKHLQLQKLALNSQQQLIYTLGEIIESRSHETANHVRRVANYSYLLAIKYGLNEHQANNLKIASPMHDIGKIGIPDHILNKPGKLSPEEFKIMKSHTQIGWDILKSSKKEILQCAAIVSMQHHEKWDGSGYPNGLKEDSIHIYGRISALADVFDALSSKRCYKDPWNQERVLNHLQQQKGFHFDPALIDLFFENLDEILEIQSLLPDDLIPNGLGVL
jgi:putative two-component system response regulator